MYLLHMHDVTKGASYQVSLPKQGDVSTFKRIASHTPATLHQTPGCVSERSESREHLHFSGGIIPYCGCINGKQENIQATKAARIENASPPSRRRSYRFLIGWEDSDLYEEGLSTMHESYFQRTTSDAAHKLFLLRQ